MHEDLTSFEREVVERLLANAPDAPEALASLNEASRGRVLRAVANAGTAAESDESSAASTERPAEAPQSTNPPSSALPPSIENLVDRVWAPTVSVGDKKLPIIPSSVALVLVILALVLIGRSCLSSPSPAWCSHIDVLIEDQWEDVSIYLEWNPPTEWPLHDSEYELTELEEDEFEEAAEAAAREGYKYQDFEGVRVWEDSLRGAC